MGHKVKANKEQARHALLHWMKDKTEFCLTTSTVYNEFGRNSKSVVDLVGVAEMIKLVEESTEIGCECMFNAKIGLYSYTVFKRHFGEESNKSTVYMFTSLDPKTFNAVIFREMEAKAIGEACATVEEAPVRKSVRI